MPVIKVVGLDPSLRNWGVAIGSMSHNDISTLKISNIFVVHPEILTGKQVRQNSIDLHRAEQLATGVIPEILDANAVFAEVPVGSQSARAMASYGICCGVLGTIRSQGITFYEVTPLEVKLSGFGKKDATKAEMIQWAMQKHPEAPWPTYNRGGKAIVSEAKAEHMADAIGAIYAGFKSNPYQQTIQMMK